VTSTAPIDLDSALTVSRAEELLPMWTRWGVPSVGLSVHSLGVTFITAIGEKLGLASVAELPAPRPGSTSLEDDVRSDSVWFERAGRSVVLVAEFERYAGKEKDLAPKVESLLLAHRRWGHARAVLLLAYWTVGLVSLPDHAQLRRVLRDGIDGTGRVRVPGSPSASVHFFQFVHQEGKDGMLRLTSILRRGSA